VKRDSRRDAPTRHPQHLAELLDFRPDQGIIRLHEQRVVILTPEGLVRAEVRRVEYDEATGRFEEEVTWHDSYEAEQHIIHIGRSDEPVCWSQCGFASGYLSYANQRETFGDLLATRQAIQWMIVDNEIDIRTARWLTLEAAHLAERKQP